jgi:O-antigen/teichoic acid export membrane protein
MVWNMASMVATQIAQATIFVMTAGRLDPLIFGLFGFAAVFVDVFGQSGTNSFTDALVQRQDFRRKALSTAFWTALGVLGSAALVMVVASAWIAKALRQPDAGPVLIALALTLFINPFFIGPFAVARHNIDFKGIALRTVVASIGGALAGLATTFTPFIEWALVVQRVVSTVLISVLMMVHTRVTPTFEFDGQSIRGFAKTAGGIFMAQGITGAVPRAIDLFVGTVFGLVVLGCLRVAAKLMDILLAALVNPISQLFTILVSQARHDAEKRSAIFVDLTAVIAALGLPGFLGVALTADEVTELLFEPGYAPVAEMMTILCGLAVLFPLANPRNSLLTAMHRLKLLVWLSAADLILVLGAMWIAKDHGWHWVLFASGIQNLTLYLLAPRALFEAMATSPARYFRALAPPYLAAALMVGAVLLVSTMIGSFGPLARLFIQAGVGAVVYLGVLWFLFRPWTLGLVQTIRSGGAT